MKQIQRIVLSVAAVLAMTILSQAADRKPIEVKKDDKCQVCGMFVAQYREWIAQVIFTDGTYAVFDGPKDMFKYYFNPAKYTRAKKQSDIQALYVTEYYSTKFMDARKLFYVVGSDVSGPMGAELVSLDSEKKAKEFMKDHHGKKVLTFPEIRREDVD